MVAQPVAAPDSQAAYDFFTTIFGDPLPDGERINLRAIHRDNRKVANEFCASALEAAELAYDLRDEWDIFTGVNPRRPNDGTKQGVTRIVAYHCDADLKAFGGSKVQAIDTLLGLELEPSLVIESGGGLHGWWLLDPALPATPDTIRQAEALMRRLYQRIGKIDPVGDVSRILRVPGTYNFKPEYRQHGQSPQVRILHASGLRYTPQDFDGVLPPLAIPQRQDACNHRYSHGQEDEAPSVEEVRELLRFIDPLIEYADWVKVLMAVNSVYPDQEGYDLCDEWSTEARENAGCHGTLLKQPLKWQGFKRSGEEGSIGIGTLYRFAQEGGWTPPRGFTLVERERTAPVPHSPSGWPALTPLAEHPLPLFPAEAFPRWLREFIEAEATATETPVDLPAMVALAALATTVAGKVEIEIKEGYREPLNLYTVTILPPGNRKSAVFNDIAAPLLEWERLESERLAPVIAEATSDRRIKERRLKDAEERAAKAKPEERLQREADVRQRAQELTEATIPVAPRLIADDVTPEQVAKLLAEQGGRLAIMSAEGGIFDIIGGRYNNNVPNLDVFLKGHAGDALRVDRVNRPPEHVRKPALTVGLTVQPDVIHGLAQKPGFRGRGLLGRFLYTRPYSLVGYRTYDAPPVPTDVVEGYQHNLCCLLNLAVPAADNQPQPLVLRLSAGAQRVMRAGQLGIERELGAGGRLEAMTDWGAKLAGAVGRIAGLLHLAKVADFPQPWATSVSEDTMQQAWEIGRYLVAHAEAVFDDMGADPAEADAHYLLGVIERQFVAPGTLTFTRSQVQQAGRARFKKATDVDAPLAVLTERGYVRPTPPLPRQGAGRAPSQAYEINPSWPTKNTENTENYPVAGISSISSNFSMA